MDLTSTMQNGTAVFVIDWVEAEGQKYTEKHSE